MLRSFNQLRFYRLGIYEQYVQVEAENNENRDNNKPSAGVSNLVPKFGQTGPKWDKSGTFKDQFQYKCTETDLKKSQICHVCGQSDPIWTPNLTTMRCRLYVD